MTRASDDGWLASAPTEAGEVRRFYDEWAERYDADLAAWDYRAPARIGRLLVEWGDPAADALDAGCGTGLSGRALRDAGCTGHLVGIDVSAPSLAIAERSGAYDEVRVGDLTAPLDFADDRFGLLACSGVLTYVPDVEPCWREFARVVRPGGVIAFSQRDDIWRERDCAEVLARLGAERVVEPLVVTGVEPYLPDSGADMATIGARYVVLRTL
jgi:predicted TPR repeat methyltransferase